jgi:hypothetical protein
MGIALPLVLLLQACPSYAQSTTTSFGTNIEPTYYYTDDAMFTDVFLHSTGFSGAQTFSADGYPTSGQAFTEFGIDGYPSGNYQFYGEGSFQIEWRGSSCSPGTFQTANNITTGTVYYGDEDPQPLGGGNSWGGIYVTPLDPNNPPKNFHLIAPGYSAYPNNPTFTQPFLQALAPFTTLRMMDYMNTNANLVTNWASRPQDNVFGFANAGNSYEKMIAMANASCKDLWINVPLYASDDWATNMAQLIKANLNPKLHVYYEYGNELWNWGFAAWQVVDTWAFANTALTADPGSWDRHGQQVAFSLMHFIQVMQPILGSQGRPILAGDTGISNYFSAGLAWIQATYGPPSQYIYAIAGSTYFFPNGNETDLDTLFTNLNNNITASLIPCIAADVALAKQYNVKYSVYEAGQSQGWSDLSTAAQQDPRMGTCYQSLVNYLISQGTDVCNFFNFVGTWSKWGYWGALTDVRQAVSSPTVKYTIETQIAQNGRPSCNCSATSSATSSTHNVWAQQEAAKNAAKAAAQSAVSKQHNTGLPQQSSGTSHMSKAQMIIWAQQEAAKIQAKAAAEQAAEAQKKHQ